jgi:hypothetical protein
LPPDGPHLFQVGETVFKLDNTKVPNGTVILMGIRYEGSSDRTDLDTTRGRQAPKVFTYALLKAGGLWYATGGPKGPQAAGWGAVNRWLGKDNRVVEWVRVATGWADLYTARVEGERATRMTVDDPSPE